MASRATQIESPSSWLTLSEPIRASLEFVGLFARLPQLLCAPRGDGHPVMVLPGFATADITTHVLRRYLDHLGYKSIPWKLGVNTGYRKLGENEEMLRRRLAEVHADCGSPVSLIGWSLGGVMSRQMAREHPEMVRQVITLGSPFTGNQDAIVIRKIYELVSGDDLSSSQARKRFRRDEAPPASVPTTAIYSRYDGITAWQNCVEKETETTSNVEVRVSHLGFTHSADVFLAIARQLAGEGAK